MKSVALMIAGAAALLLAPAAVTAQKPPAAKPRPAPARDWSRTVAITPEGGFRMGNPAARVKLVEYGSLACPHCRNFQETGVKPLVQQYVRTGRVSYEFRNLLLNGPDVAVSLLTRCSGPARFFPMAEAVFTSQPQWFDKIHALTDAQKAEIEALPDQQRIARLAEAAGFPQIAARFGVSPVRARQCLADPKGLERLLGITKAARDMGINRTPTFLIDGKLIEGSTWEQLEPQLKSALTAK